jgi:hypothetical protein
VVIPFAQRLVEMIPDDRVEGRRAVGLLLGSVAASALLHQFQRERDEQGRVLATADDYAVVRKLLAGPMGRILGSGISPAVERFYERLRAHVRENHCQFRTTQAAKGETVTERAVRGWLNELSEAGFVEMVEANRGPKPAEWRLVDDPPDPGDNAGLPEVEQLFRVSDFRLSDKGFSAAHIGRKRKCPFFSGNFQLGSTVAGSIRKNHRLPT